jgi:D-alanyl-lipoteichoic acid acyltransferase DltB (MBOAT superfamily)
MDGILSYNKFTYFLVFLPLVIILYQLMPKKFRWAVLLLASYAFFFSFSRKLVLYNVAASILTYAFGRILGSMKKAPEGMDRKAFKKKKHRILVLAVLIDLGALVLLKYSNFFGRTFASLTGSTFSPVEFLVPLGISYYTLQCISYLCDVAGKKIEPTHHFFQLALYLSFFPTIMEGPICRFDQIGEDLYAGNSVTSEHLALGYERILFGLFKKIIIADRLSPVVDNLFAYHTGEGALCLLAAILFTLQMYMDFSGMIDIGIGSARIFGITVPENFRQPFFAKNAGDFWRRWHITLGTFFRDYIFYPVSLSKPIQHLTKWTGKHVGKKASRYIGPLIALLCVWLANGLWHGPHWNYIVYGLYYFSLTAIEMFTEKPFEAWCHKHNLNIEGAGIRTFRFIKLVLIVITGEMFFRAVSLHAGWTMLVSIFTNFDVKQIFTVLPQLDMSREDYLIVAVAFAAVIAVSVLKEKKFPIREKFNSMPTMARWAILYVIIFAIVLFGAYGPGYDAVAAMYAGF